MEETVPGVTINARSMRAEASGAHAEWHDYAAASGSGAWVSSALPGRLLDRDQAIASLVLADLVFYGWASTPKAATLRAQLGIPAPPPDPVG